MPEPGDPTTTSDQPVAESTTLITFLLQGLRKANRIELFGSWDNFHRPYPMSRDNRRGRGYWRGIHTFKNIICDGDLSNNVPIQRDGALRTGGLYWYFYRVDGYEDYHNPAEPSTNCCPLLPGQTVNVLEVPSEAPLHPDADPSKIDLMKVMTLNPEDRWAPLKRKRNANDATSQERSVSNHRRLRLMKTARNLHTAHGTTIGRVASGITDLLSAGHTNGFCRSRPKSCPSAVDCEELRPQVHEKPDLPCRETAVASSRSYSQVSQCSTPATSQTDGKAIQGNRSGKLPLAVLKDIQELLKGSRYLASRARTAVETNSNSGGMFGTLEEAEMGSMSPIQHNTRPASAPSSFQSAEASAEDYTLSDSEKLTKRMRSLRLRIACAKLRKLQHELGDSSVDTDWILSSLPDTYSGLLQNFGERNEQTRETLSETPDVSEELSQSPPQLCFSSRGSMMWTPDTASLLGTSEDGLGLGLSFRTSIRDSMEFQVAVHNNGHDLVEQPQQDSKRNPNLLGARFSSFGLDSQETIKPVNGTQQGGTIAPECNPFSKTVGSRPSQSDADHSNTDELASVQKQEVGSDHLMNDLNFLAKVIA